MKRKVVKESAGCPILGLGILIVGLSTAPAFAEPRNLRLHGRTLVEAEDFSTPTERSLEKEFCETCSGKQSLSFFWRGDFIQFKVNVRRDCDFTVFLRTSSRTGSSLALERVGSDPDDVKRLAVFDAPNTEEWERYAYTNEVNLSLSAGTHLLRLENLVNGANIDYISFLAHSDAKVTIYQPPKNAGPDKNPLKGFCSGWWRPDDDYATVGFQYIEWGRLEPQDDEFDWDYVEEVLNRPGSAGRHLVLQFVVDWDGYEPIEKNYLGPSWLLERVGEHRGHAIAEDATSRAMRATKYNDPVFVAEAVEAIEALTAYFQDDPRVFVLQSGVLGFWAEWHTFPHDEWNPSASTKQTILNTYLANLPKDRFTQIRYPDETAVKPQAGIGYVNGSATLTDHGYDFGRKVQAGALWKNGPITGEWPPNVELPIWQRFFLTDDGPRFVQQARYTTLLMPEHKEILQKLPNWDPNATFLEMHQQLGYNLQVDEVRYERSDDGPLQLNVTLKNIGIAPFYANWNVQLALIHQFEVVDLIPVDVDLRRLQPGGSIQFNGVTKVSAPPKRIGRTDPIYQIGLRILQPEADAAKPTRWPLDARHVYVVLANDVHVMDGLWDSENALVGGWNVIGDVINPHQMNQLFPFAGEVRAVGQTKAEEAETDEKQAAEK